MKEIIGFMPGPWKREDSVVYALNKKGSNRFCFNVQCGWDDEGNRVDCDEVYAVARLCQVAPELYAECKQLAARVQELEEENKNLGLALSDKQFEYAANVLAAESDKYGWERLMVRLAYVEGLLKKWETAWAKSGYPPIVETSAFLYPKQGEKEEEARQDLWEVILEEVYAEVAAGPKEEKQYMLEALAEVFRQELRRVSTAEAAMANDSDLAGKVEKEGGE
jgi:hypothetical protein